MMAPRTLVVGDIHGCLRALDAVLSAAAAGYGDTLVVLGDMIDRGPESLGVIEKLLDFKEKGKLVALRGNHEIMMVQAMKTGRDGTWLKSGGLSTLKSMGYKGFGPWRDLVPDAVHVFLHDECADFWENDRFVMSHAGFEAGLPLSDQPDSVLFWNSLESDPVPHYSGKISVHGHTVMPGFQPMSWPHAWFLDTGVYLEGGWLTCVDLDTQEIWQGNQEGQTRAGQWSMPTDHR